MVGVATVVSAVQGFAGPGRVTPESVDRAGNVHLIDAAEAAGADVVLMSVVGASADSPMELFRAKYAAEQHLRASGVPLDHRPRDGVRRVVGRDHGQGAGLRTRRQPDQLRLGPRRRRRRRPGRRAQRSAGRGPRSRRPREHDIQRTRGPRAGSSEVRPEGASCAALAVPRLGAGRRQPRAALAMDTIDMTFAAAAGPPHIADLPMTGLRTALADDGAHFRASS